MTTAPDPEPAAATARVHGVDPQRVDPRFVESALSDAEKQQADRFHFPADALSWSATRAALRGVLAASTGREPRDIEFSWGPNGKPAIPQRHFNLSHTRGFAVILVSPAGPVGIDLEHRDRAATLLDCVDAFCHPDEIAHLPAAPGPRAAALLEIWVHKEALLKAIGTGLSFDPRQLRLHGDGGISDRPLAGLGDLKRCPLTLDEAPGYRIAAAAPRSVHEILPAPLPEGIDIPPPSVRGSREAPPV